MISFTDAELSSRKILFCRVEGRQDCTVGPGGKENPRDLLFRAVMTMNLKLSSVLQTETNNHNKQWILEASFYLPQTLSSRFSYTYAPESVLLFFQDVLAMPQIFLLNMLRWTAIGRASQKVLFCLIIFSLCTALARVHEDPKGIHRVSRLVWAFLFHTVCYGFLLHKWKARHHLLPLCISFFFSFAYLTSVHPLNKYLHST